MLHNIPLPRIIKYIIMLHNIPLPRIIKYIIMLHISWWLFGLLILLSWSCLFQKIHVGTKLDIYIFIAKHVIYMSL